MGLLVWSSDDCIRKRGIIKSCSRYLLTGELKKILAELVVSVSESVAFLGDVGVEKFLCINVCVCKFSTIKF